MPSRSYLSRATLIIATVSMLGLAPAAAAQAVHGAPEYRSPGTARTLSIFAPGAGHFYSGEHAKATLLLTSSVGALVAGYVLSDFERDYDYTCQSNNCYDPDAYDPNYTPAVVGAGVAAAIWLYALIDAPSAARRANRRANGSANQREQWSAGVDTPAGYLRVNARPTLQAGSAALHFSARLSL